MLARARTCIVVMVAILCATPFFVRADVIDSFAVTIHIQTDGSARVTEVIRYDFGTDEHHGIYRDIPAAYIDGDGNKQPVIIDSVLVIDGKMSPIAFESFKNGDDLRLKIGDPDVLITGKKTYEISYVARGVVSFFDDHDELYWNVTGNEWLFPILHSSARVYAPASTTLAACYAGPVGSSVPCDVLQTIADDGSAWFFETKYPLSINEGLTVAVGWPKGVVAPPAEASIFWKHFLIFGPLALPIVAFSLLFHRWWNHGRDDMGRGTIIPEYDTPKGISPMLASEIMFERVTSASFSATIIELAVRGYLKIHREEEKTLGIFTSVNYRFEKQKPADEHLADDELKVYSALFKSGDSVTSDDLSKSGDLAAAKSAIGKDAAAKMVTHGYYRANPTVVKVLYVLAGVTVLIIGLILTVGFGSPWIFVGFLLTGVLIGVFGLIMPAKTRKGSLAKEQILGLKDYLQIAEKNRLDFHHAPEKSPELFEKLLPYAMVLGVSVAWAKEFEGFFTTPPRWYDGGSYAAFAPIAFADDMNAMSTAVSTLATPASSGGGAGGGGFSGGGFGGGGGGSW